MNDADSFVATFFGAGNDLSVEQLRPAHPQLAGWLDKRISNLRAHPGGPHVLPRRTDGATRWYGLAHSDRQLRELTEHLSAFTVPTYARIDRRPLRDSDPIDQAARQFTDGHVVVLDVLPGQQEHARRAIELLGEVGAQRPQRQIALSRPLGRLLREFEMAVMAAADTPSADLLAEIERSGQVSADNLLFLRVRRLGGLHRYGDLLTMPELATLLMMRRPAQVSAILFDAVYTTQLAHFEVKADPVGALTHFSDTVLTKYPALFKSRHGLQTQAAIKAYFLYSTVTHPDDVTTRDQLLAAPDLTDGDRQFLEQIDRHGHRPLRDRPTLAEAEAEARRGNFDIAFPIARIAPPSVERAEVLLRCAVEMRTIEAMTAAVKAVESLTKAERVGITRSRWFAGPWEDVLSTLAGPDAEAAEAIPTSWPQWFERVIADPQFTTAVSIAEHGAVEWSAADLTDEASARIHVALNTDLASSAHRMILDGLPSFLGYVERCANVRPHRDLFEDIATLLLMVEDAGVADVQILVGVFGSLLETGVSAGHYRQLIDDFLELWQRISSPAQLDNAIELLDLLLAYSAPDPGARDMFFNAVVASVTRWRRRVRPDQWSVLTDLASEIGSAGSLTGLLPAATPNQQDSDSLRRDLLKGKTIAIYTLTEQAGLRAKEFLERHFDDVTVEVANEHVASDRLAGLAHNADMFVLATRSAKHAATNCIQAQRPPDLPTLFAGGKGSTSLIQAVLGHLV